jgi:glycosyltransferase involved in cell wall biosynthesis
MGQRILFDALAARYGGTAYAAVQLARHLARHTDVSEVKVVSRIGSIVQRGLAADSDVRCVALAEGQRAELLRRLAWEAVRMPVLARRGQCDAVITMSAVPLAPSTARLTCLLSNPVMYETQSAPNAVRRWAVRRSARRAVYVAAPSQFMADLVSASTRVACAVVPWGVDHEVFSPAHEPGQDVLCVADFYAHKRHDLLLDAWLRLPTPRPRLRLIGNPAVDPGAHARLAARISGLPDNDLIVLESGVSLDRLIAAYRSARVFVMPSRRESFCMPLAESMACGVPPVVRDIRSLRETGDNGAAYVGGDDPSLWAESIRRLLADDDYYAHAREAAIAAAARLSWERCATSLLDHL